MARYLRDHSLALIALIVALGGTSYAAVQLSAGSVGTKELAKKAVTAKKLAKGAVRSPQVKDGSLLEQDFRAGELPAGATGPQGPQGIQGNQGPAGSGERMFIADGSYTVPPGITGVLAELRGGGGGGSFFNADMSGAQGGFVRAYLPVNPGDVLTITVGANGIDASSSAGGGLGTDGGASRIVRSAVTVADAAGGKGGTGLPGGPTLGGAFAVAAPAVGLEGAVGANGTTSGTSSAGTQGGGPPNFRGSGGGSGNGPGTPRPGYVSIQPLTG